MFDFFIPFGAFAIVMIGIISLIVIAVTIYNVVTYFFNKDWNDERFD